KGSEVLATFEDGAPAVAVARRGQGRGVLYTSTVDRDWSDFPIRTSFLPLLQRFSAFLSGSLEEREEVKAVGGNPAGSFRPGHGRNGDRASALRGDAAGASSG